MLILRSVVFNILFYLNLFRILRRRSDLRAAAPRLHDHCKVWGRTSNWLLRAVAGMKVEYRGLEKILPVRCSSLQSINRSGKPSRCCRCSTIRPSSSSAS